MSNCNFHKAIRPNVPSFSRTPPPCTELYNRPNVVDGICAGFKTLISPQTSYKTLVLVDVTICLRACDIFCNLLAARVHSAVLPHCKEPSLVSVAVRQLCFSSSPQCQLPASSAKMKIHCFLCVLCRVCTAGVLAPHTLPKALKLHFIPI